MRIPLFHELCHFGIGIFAAALARLGHFFDDDLVCKHRVGIVPVLLFSKQVCLFALVVRFKALLRLRVYLFVMVDFVRPVFRPQPFHCALVVGENAVGRARLCLRLGIAELRRFCALSFWKHFPNFGIDIFIRSGYTVLNGNVAAGGHFGCKLRAALRYVQHSAFVSVFIFCEICGHNAQLVRGGVRNGFRCVVCPVDSL